MRQLHTNTNTNTTCAKILIRYILISQFNCIQCILFSQKSKSYKWKNIFCMTQHVFLFFKNVLERTLEHVTSLFSFFSDTDSLKFNF